MDGGSRVDVEVVATDDSTVGDVLDVLRSSLPVAAGGLWSSSGRLPEGLPLRSSELRHGAVLGLGAAAAPAARSGAPSALELRVVGGPDAGRSAPLRQGTHVVGRGAGSAVVLDDPGVSRRHLELRVGAGRVLVSDLGSANGSILADHDLDAAPHPWPAGERLRLGATTLAVAGPDPSSAALDPGSGGRDRLRPPVRIPVAAAAAEIPFPAPPVPPPPRRTAWLAIALPAVGGGVLAWVMGVPTFLFFALLGPVVAVAGWWSERRSGRRAHRRELAEHERRRAAAERSLEGAVRDALQDLHRSLPDVGALVTAARRRTSLLWSRRVVDADALLVRLGTGPGPSGVLRREPDGARVPQVAPSVPVELDLRRGGLAVVGPRDRTTGLLRSVVGQLAALHGPDVLELLLVTTTDGLRDWRWMRWLPHVAPGAVTVLEAPAGGAGEDDGARALLRRLDALVHRRSRSARTGGDPLSWPGPWAVVLLDGSVPGPLASALRDAAAVGVLVLTHATTSSGLPVSVHTAVEVTGETGAVAVVRSTGAPERRAVVLDQLPRDVARCLARDLAGLAPAERPAAVPTDVRALDLPGTGLHAEPAGRLTGRWSRARDALLAPLGAGADGPVVLDLCRSGPHALVAGTTGSGKSELLQTLIAGLALAHPPDRCSFLLVDYKGGAAFAEAAALPHTVGLLTDLDGAGTARALRSLTAELVRREAVLAEHGVSDVSALPEGVPLARLVIIVDEFATLAEELPAFVPGLVGIAQRGRSLGVHLVLATQRPAGVVSPEIRANCTLRICLRTTDESDSRDVLGGPEAAHLPVELPGRAFLRTGSGEPRLMQVGRVSQPWRSADAPPVEVRRWSWPVPPSAADGRAQRTHDRSDLAVVVAALRAHADRLDIPAPHRPWCPPLPDRYEPAAPDRSGAGGGLLLGLVDRPDEQAQRPLTLDLDEGGTWLAVGGPRSGRTTLLRSVLGQAVSRRGPEALHVHVIDLAGGTLAAEASQLPQVGTAIGTPDAHRVVRLVDRLLREVDDRRRGVRSTPAPGLLLLVDGAETLCTMLDEGDPAGGSPALLRLLRDGAAAGLTGVVTADRAIPGGRLAAVATSRLVLPLADRADYAVAGVPLHAVPSARPPGRALLGEDAAECQLVLPPPEPLHRAAPRSRGGGTPPLRVVELPPDPHLEGCEDRIAAAAELRLVVGPGGDDGADVAVDLARTGGLLVVGPAGSGRSSAIEAFAGDLLAAGVPLLDLRRGRPSDGDRSGADITDTATVSAWLATMTGRTAVVCVDDLGAPADAPALTLLPPPGAASRVVLLAGGHGGSLATWFQGPVAALRRSRSGLLLTPGPGDAEVLGGRLPRTALPCRPGSGWLVDDGTPVRVQVARHRARPESRPQVSSSSGPISCLAYHASS